jgi:CheY-like chemotaxis protein
MPKVLIVDDLESNRYVLKTLIKLFGPRAGVEVLEASSGVTSVEIIRNERPDLILMDVKMEREDSGIETVKVIRSLPEFRDVPIWAVTAQAMDAHDGMESDRDRCLRAGFSEYLTKPIDQSRLLVSIADTLGLTIPEKVKLRMGIGSDNGGGRV